MQDIHSLNHSVKIEQIFNQLTSNTSTLKDAVDELLADYEQALRSLELTEDKFEELKEELEQAQEYIEYLKQQIQIHEEREERLHNGRMPY